MMKRFNGLLLLSAIALPALLQAWGTADYVAPPLQAPQNPVIPSEISFPLNADQEWFVKPSLLVWRPYQDDIDSGSMLKVPAATPVISENKTQNVNFNWSTGVRFTVGKYLPHHEEWDVTLASTYFYGSANKESKGIQPTLLSLLSEIDLKIITQGWNPDLLGTVYKTNLDWHINYFTWDLAVGRLYTLTPKIVIHPFLCLRTVLMYQTYRTSNDTLTLVGTSTHHARKTYFKASNGVWGIGPRIGSDFSFYFGRGWAFLGSLSGSAVMGRYNIKETIDGFVLNGLGVTPTRFKFLDADTIMRANLEGSLGLGWEKWVRKHTVRVAPSFLFEVTQWFLINNWAATNLAALPVSDSFPDWGMLSERRMGDLGFLGFTVNLQIDF